MAKTVANIVVGAPSTVVVSAYGVAEGGGVDLGSTEGGLKITYTPEFYKVKADQWTGVVDTIKTAEDMTIEVTLAEASLANLGYAFGYPTGAVSGSALYIGGSSTVTKRTLYINGNAPDGGTMKITVHRVAIIGATEVGMTINNKTMLKVTFQVLQDTAQTASQQFLKFEYSSTDTTPPTVAMTTPAEDGAVVKAAKGTVTLTITETGNPIDESTLIYGDNPDASIFINNVTDGTATALVAGTIVYNSATKTIIFTPDSVWGTTQKYQVIITTKLRDLAGNHLAATFYGHFTSTS